MGAGAGVWLVCGQGWGRIAVLPVWISRLVQGHELPPGSAVGHICSLHRACIIGNFARGFCKLEVRDVWGVS